MQFNRLFLLSTFIISYLFYTDLRPQANAEDRPIYWLDEVVVVADRIQGQLKESTWATSVLSHSTLQQLPAKTLG